MLTIISRWKNKAEKGSLRTSLANALVENNEQLRREAYLILLTLTSKEGRLQVRIAT